MCKSIEKYFLKFLKLSQAQNQMGRKGRLYCTYFPCIEALPVFKMLGFEAWQLGNM